MPERLTRDAICLEAREMDAMTVASSLSIVPLCSSCGCKRGQWCACEAWKSRKSASLAKAPAPYPDQPRGEGEELVLALLACLHGLGDGSLRGKARCSILPCGTVIRKMPGLS